MLVAAMAISMGSQRSFSGISSLMLAGISSSLFFTTKDILRLSEGCKDLQRLRLYMPKVQLVFPLIGNYGDGGSNHHLILSAESDQERLQRIVTMASGVSRVLAAQHQLNRLCVSACNALTYLPVLLLPGVRGRCKVKHLDFVWGRGIESQAYDEMLRDLLVGDHLVGMEELSCGAFALPGLVQGKLLGLTKLSIDIGFPVYGGRDPEALVKFNVDTGLELARAMMTGHLSTLQEFHVRFKEGKYLQLVAHGLKDGSWPHLIKLSMTAELIDADACLVLAQALWAGVCPLLQQLELQQHEPHDGDHMLPIF